MTERTFTIAEVCAAVGISPPRLHQWIERGQFDLLPDERGQGRTESERNATGSRSGHNETGSVLRRTAAIIKWQEYAVR